MFGLKLVPKRFAALVFLGWTNGFKEFGLAKVPHYGIADPVVYSTIVPLGWESSA